MVIPPSPLLDSTTDLITLLFISAILLFSLFSITFTLHFRFKTRKSHHLKDFNSLWTVRILLVSLISLWALNELLRLPSLFPFLPRLTLTQHSIICKIHIVLSLGFMEPGFLVTLLFLVNVSLRKRNPKDTWAIAIVLTTCLPILALQLFFVFFSPEEDRLPEFFYRSSLILKSHAYGDDDSVLCTYPLSSTMVFSAFGIAYVLCFLLSCWRVVTLVINKGLRVRIYALALAVLISIPMQILFLGMSVLWEPNDANFQVMSLLVFTCVASCSAVGQGILVIRPIADALAIGGESCRWRSGLGEKGVIVGLE